MGPRPDNSGVSGSFRRRFASSLVMVPLALGALIAGWPYFDMMLLLVGLAMAWEWDHLCQNRFRKGSGLVLMIAVALGIISMALGYWAAALGCLAVATCVIASVGSGHKGYAVIGPAYIGLPCLSLQYLRGDEDFGLMLAVWVMGLVWATDIGGYVFGKNIGGPKLAPRLSPNKTWAGLIGGVVSATLVGGGIAYIAGVAMLSGAFMLSALLAVIAQLGDLFESGVKRRFGVKDSGRLIPGHGGVLDRVDGMLFVAPVVAALMLVFS